MDLQITQINGANANVATTILSDELDSAKEKITKNFAKKAKIDGFRAGKVPSAVIKSRYKNEIEKEAEQDLLQKLLTNSLEKMDKKPADVVGEPVFKKFQRNEKDIEVEIVISFRPQITLDGYEECVPAFAKPKVLKKEIQERKEKLLELVAPLTTLEEDRALADKDYALFDFEGSVDGELFEGGSAKNYSLQIGSNQFIPGFEDGMLGLKKGENKDIKVSFPSDYGAAHLAGKEAIFKVLLHQIQTKQVPEQPTKEMLQQLLRTQEDVSEEKLDEQVKEQIRLEKTDKIFEEDLKPKFIDAVLEKIDFDLPENILEQELDMQVRQNWGSFSEEEIEGFKKDPKTLQDKRESFRDDAVKSVKLTFIVDELAKKNDIQIADQEVMQRLYFEALQQGQNPQEYLKMYQEQGYLPAVKMAMIEDKLFRSLFFKDEQKEDKKED